eukprot:39389_1
MGNCTCKKNHQSKMWNNVSKDIVEEYTTSNDEDSKDMCENKNDKNKLKQKHKQQIASFLTNTDVEQLKIGDKIDHMLSENGLYFAGTIIDKFGTRLKIHYDDDIENKHDEWSDYKHEPYRYVKTGSITKHV